MPSYPTTDRPTRDDFAAAGYTVADHEVYILVGRGNNLFAVQRSGFILSFVPERTGNLQSEVPARRAVVISDTSEAVEEYAGWARQNPSVVAIEIVAGSGEFVRCRPIDAVRLGSEA